MSGISTTTIHSRKLSLRQRVGYVRRQLKRQVWLQAMAMAVVVWLFVFCYIPIFGLQIAFKDYSFNKGILGSPWVGLKQFIELWTDINIPKITINTVCISAIKTFLIFPVPIILALMLNEVRNMRFKRTVQTISYFPYFISWAVVAFMATTWLSPSTGFVDSLLTSLGVLKQPYFFLGSANAFWWVSLGLEIWKNAGWGAIIYLAAIAGIDQEMYEAAYIDGAGRFQRILHITLPSILGTIMILFILNIGAMMGGGLYASNFQLSYLLNNPLNIDRSDILDTYVLRTGITYMRYSYAASVGLLYSLISMILLFSSNYISKKLTNESFF